MASSTQCYYTEPIAQGPSYRLLDQSETPSAPDPSLQFKIVIVGDSGCGKTSLLSSYIRGSFPSEYEPTIFENHRAFLQDTRSNKVLTVDLWDTAGQEDYERLRRLSYQDSNLIILAYSLASRDSLLNIPEVWAPEILGFCENTPILLVGLKSDVPEHQVDPVQAVNVARSIGAVAHLQCSAMQMHNVDKLFDACVNVVYNTHQNASRGSKRFSKSTGHFRSASKNTNTVPAQTYAASVEEQNKESGAHYGEHYQSDKCCTIV